MAWPLFLALMLPLSVQAAPQTQDEDRDGDIVVTAPMPESERREQIRDLAREVIRAPRRGRPFGQFRYPVCPTVIGIGSQEAREIEARIRENAERLGTGADTDEDCTPTIRVAFMAPDAGPADAWLDEGADQIAHMPLWQRRAVLGEKGPVRAYNRVVLRDANGEALIWNEKHGRVVGQLDRETPAGLQPFGRSDPIHVNEITGAAIMIERDAADGFTLAQLADYITMRTLLGTGAPEPGATVAAPTILTLFQADDPPEGLTHFDEALLRGVYDASRNSSQRRVIADIAIDAVRAERSAVSAGASGAQ